MNEKQVLFTRLMAELIVQCSSEGIDMIGAELFRTPEQAEIYAKSGKGIRNSNHTRKLAIDLFRYKDGSVSWNHADYERAGEIWKGLHELCRWGGDFTHMRDSPHFSLYHNGVI